MATGKDIERIQRNLSFEELTSKIRQDSREDEVLGSIKELGRRQEPRRIEVFGQVLEDPKYNAGIKKTVITELGTEARRENQDLLLQHLDRQDDSTLVLAARSLGKIGDENALKRLEAAKSSNNPTARRAIQFSQSLISYRLRVNTHLISPPANEQLVTVRDGIRFEVTKAEPATVQKAISQAARDLPAMSLSAESAAKVTCRGNELLLVFAEGFDQPEKLATLRERNAAPLVVLKTGLSEGGYFLDGYVFTHPVAIGKVKLLVVRPRGELTLVGEAEIANDKVVFSVNAVESPFTPAVDIAGEYQPRDRSWSFTRTATTTTVAAPKRGVVIPRKATRTFR